jgi:deoxyuridine 5'-triphosphate nucleotidohydrolase
MDSSATPILWQPVGADGGLGRPLAAPRRCSDLAAGIDLCADHGCVVPPGGSAVLVGTGVAFALPAGTVGIVKSRSSLAAKHDIEVGAGVIDADYRGEVRVLLRNFGRAPFEVSPGDRIGQLVVLPLHAGALVQADTLDETRRGAGGFGSTGRSDVVPQ